jgi:hypothetical protein
MDLRDYDYRNRRDTWNDFNDRQKFEHDLINRKTTWLLTTEGILFAAYGVTFRTEQSPGGFRVAVAVAGLSIAVLTLLGVGAVINSKRLSWHDYRDFYDKPNAPKLPRHVKRPLAWGVNTWNTRVSLAPDILLPLVFLGTWSYVLATK